MNLSIIRLHEIKSSRLKQNALNFSASEWVNKRKFCNKIRSFVP